MGGGRGAGGGAQRVCDFLRVPFFGGLKGHIFLTFFFGPRHSQIEPVSN